jgi:hypothetical protein
VKQNGWIRAELVPRAPGPLVLFRMIFDIFFVAINVLKKYLVKNK